MKINELKAAILKLLPDADFQQDNEGQLVIYTGHWEGMSDGEPVTGSGSAFDRLARMAEEHELTCCLDDLVHDASGTYASGVNNGGPEDQIQFIIDQFGEQAGFDMITTRFRAALVRKPMSVAVDGLEELLAVDGI
jgi:hypothetical protein